MSATTPDLAIFFGRPDRSAALAADLRARGFRVTVYGHQGAPGTYVHVPYSFPRAVARLLRTRHAAYLTGLSFVPSIALYVNRVLRGLPYVFNATGLKSQIYHDRAGGALCPALAERYAYPALMDRVLAGATTIACNSRYLERQLAAEFPRYAAKMLTVYNAIDLDRYASAVPAALGDIPRHAPKLVSVTTWNFAAKAGAARILVGAMGPITARYAEARLIFAVKASHPRYAEEIERHVAARPWAGSIRILYNQTNIPQLLAAADLFVYASAVDSLPRALLEAHAARLPIVTTAVAGCGEVVEDGRTGFVVPSDANAVAARVMELLADPAKRGQFGHRGWERVRDLFGRDRMADAYARVLRHVVDTSARTVPAHSQVRLDRERP